jgi:hypothetical protein
VDGVGEGNEMKSSAREESTEKQHEEEVFFLSAH